MNAATFGARRMRGAQPRLVFLLALLASTFQGLAASDLYMRDTNSDTGLEPYTGPGPVYLSPDIWVRNEPDPNFDPYPFNAASPPWTPQTHQNPEYRDSKTGRPNYVYVRVRNRGNEASSGTERLRLYQSKASTGLSWPASWVDNVGMICGDDHLLGIEITKPRQNAQSVSATERNAYRDALLAIQSDSQFQYSDGTQYWRKQNDIHAGFGNPQHGNPAFVAWHREMMNRYEERLREANPLVTLLYWDFTQNPTMGTNLFTTSFMGASSGLVGAPLAPLQPPTLRRNVGGADGGCAAGNFESDSSISGMSGFPSVATTIEESPNHNCAHGFIGGYDLPGVIQGQISFLSTAAQDPMFFILHANVDRQWANWQRENANPGRLDPVATYGGDSSDININDSMSPWDGATSMAPWTGAAAYSKTSKHPSVVYPPIYDTAPLRIPVLQPGEAVVIEIPWYPPDVNNYNCSGQAGHFCLLARIETQTSTPFGMTFTEGTSVGTNTRNNNNIAWKNVTIVDNVMDAAAFMMATGALIRNVFKRDAIFDVVLVDRTEERRFELLEHARLIINLPPDILERVVDLDRMRDLELVRDDTNRQRALQIVGKEPRFGIKLAPHETFTAQFSVRLRDKDIPREWLVEPFLFDIEQRLDLPEDYFGEDRMDLLTVGGVRFAVDFAALQRNLNSNEDNGDPPRLRVELRPEKYRGLPAAQEREESEIRQHYVVGEPVLLNVESTTRERLRELSVDVDGETVARVRRDNDLTESIRFEQPGVRFLQVRAVDAEGRQTVRRIRVLVSETIPPNAIIIRPESGERLATGEPIEIVVESAAAFEREVEKVALYVKEGDDVATGLNLIVSDNYQPVDEQGGAGPHTFRFTPKKPGMYMFQVGATDDRGSTGVSRHVMVHVE